MKNSSILFILLLCCTKGNFTFDDKNILLFENATKEVHEASKDENVTQDSIEFLKNRRVFKGTKSKIKYYPFVVSIHLMKQYQCVGSIIKSDLVITACSCVQLLWNNRFYRENPSVISVNVGSSFYTGGGESLSIIEAYFHPRYEPQTLKNNLAILRLIRRLNFRKNYVKKINIAPPGKLSYKTEEIVLIGWGAKTISNNIAQPWSNRLSYAELQIFPLSECQEVYHGKYERVTLNNFCGGFYSKGGGACNGDVGAPAIIDNQLVGVVSFASPSCGAVGKPTVFTNLAMYRDWIISIIDKIPPVQKKFEVTSDPFKPLYLMSDEDKGNTTTETTTSPPSSIKIEPIVEPDTNTPEYVDIPTTTPHFVDIPTTTASSELRSGAGKLKSDKRQMKELILNLFESQEFVELYKNLTNKLLPVTPTEAQLSHESNEVSNEESLGVGLGITKMDEIIDEVEDSDGLDLALPDSTTLKSKSTTKHLTYIMQPPDLRNNDRDDEYLKQFNDRDIIMLYLPDRKNS